MKNKNTSEPVKAKLRYSSVGLDGMLVFPVVDEPTQVHADVIAVAIDGMALDCAGNIYLTASGQVIVLDAARPTRSSPPVRHLRFSEKISPLSVGAAEYFHMESFAPISPRGGRRQVERCPFWLL